MITRDSHPDRQLSAASSDGLLRPDSASDCPVVPAIVTAGVVTAAGAISVASAAPAKAATASPCSGTVMVFPDSVNGGTSSAEAKEAAALGCTVTLFSASAASAYPSGPEGYFAQFAAIIIGDPDSGSCSTNGTPETTVPADALAYEADWGPVITGDVALLGTAPVLAGGNGTQLLDDAMTWAVTGGASGKTGLYVSLDCDYYGSAAGTPALLLSQLYGGGFTVTGNKPGTGPACADSGTVNTWEADESVAFRGFASSILAASKWGNSPCPVEETIAHAPANFTPVAYDAAAAAPNFTASDGQTGQPYVLLGSPLPSGATKALTPSNGGALGGGPVHVNDGADPGLAQPDAGDPVDTENGDFTQTNTDESVPAPGLPLEFDRTYDALAAQSQEATDAPGPLGFGWSDNWATSAASASPVADDIYSLTGEAGAVNSQGLPEYAGNGQAASAVPVAYPNGVLESAGNLYYSDSQDNRVEEIPGSSGAQWGISMTAGDVYTIAGSATGQAGHTTSTSTTNVVATSGLLSDPRGLAMDSAGDLYIADWGNNRVQEIPAAGGTVLGGSAVTSNPVEGDIYTVAGGQMGDSGDGGPAPAAALGNVFSVTVDSSGDLFIADTSNNRVQEVPNRSGTWYGQAMTADDMYTIAGSSTGTAGASSNGTASKSALLDGPSGVFVYSAGIYIADTLNCRVEMIPGLTGTQWGISMNAADLYTVAGRDAADCTGGGTGKPATQSDLDDPDAVTYNNGNLFVTSTAVSEIEEVAAANGTQFGQAMTADDVYIVAGNGTAGNTGNGSIATSAELNNPGSVSVYGGIIYIADTDNNQIRQVAANGNISVAAGSGQTMASTGDGFPAVNGYINDPGGEAADAQGNLYIADTRDNRIQEIAATTHTQWGNLMQAGDVYTIAGSKYGMGGNSGDGKAATSALLSMPEGIAFDAAGDLIFADQGNNQVREISAATGNISTIAGSASGASGTATSVVATSGQLNQPFGVTVDSKGDIYIADKMNNRIQEIYASGGKAWGSGWTAGDIYTVAGSPTGGSGATGVPSYGSAPVQVAGDLNAPEGVTTDPAGDLYIADTTNDAIEEIPVANGTQWNVAMNAGDIYTVAGVEASPGAGAAGQPALSSQLHTPVGITLDAEGDLYVADAYNDRVQEVAAADGSQWGQQMTFDYAYTVAGQPGQTIEGGDGGPATAATIANAESVAVDADGNLYIGDWYSGHLREVVSSTATTINPAAGQTSALYPAPAGITVTEPDGSQVTFYSQAGGTCPAPYVAGGSYCVLPISEGATLTSNSASQTYTFAESAGAGTYTYSWTGQLRSETDEAGVTTTITPQSPAPGQPVSGDSSQVCPAMVAGIATYSCQTITAASGRALVLGSNASGQITSVTDPMGHSWTYAYTAGCYASPIAGTCDLASATDPDGNTTSYTYDTTNTSPSLVADLLTVMTPNAQASYNGPDKDPGATTTNVYNSAGQVTSQTDPMGYKTTWNYCASKAAGNCMNAATGTGFVTVADPDGNSTVYDYDEGTLAAETRWTGTTMTTEQDFGPDVTEDSTAAAGTLLDNWAANGDGVITTYTYDSNGDTVAVTTPDSTGTPTTTTAWYTQGNQTCSATAEAATPCGNTGGAQTGPATVTAGTAATPLTITPPSAPPSGETWTLYDSNGNPLYTTTGVYQPNGTLASTRTSYQLYAYDSVTLPSTSTAITCTNQPSSPELPCAKINPDGTVTQLTYDSQGDLSCSSVPDGNGTQVAAATYGYDADGDQTSAVAPDGNTSCTTPAADAANYTTETAYDSNGNVTSVTQAYGSTTPVIPRTTTYAYDPDGNKITVTDPRGYATTTAYNADDQATLVTDPDTNKTLTCYDGIGNVTQTVPPAGVKASNLSASSCPTSYPSGYGDRLTASAPNDATTWTYNGDGEQTSMTSPAPAGQTSPAYETTSYTYDSAGHLIQTSAPAASTGGPAQVTVSTYTLAGQLASQTTGYGTTSAGTTSYCYDPDGDQTSVVMPDGNTGVTYANGTVTGLATCPATSPWTVTAAPQANYQTTLAYDSAGEQVSATTPATAAAPQGATTTSTYDPAGQLLATTDPDGVTTTMTYTPNGNTATVTYTGTSSAHSVTDTYDADGNQTGMTDGTGSSSYVYDPFGELTSATSGASKTVTYGYDADGDPTSITYPLPATATWATSDAVTYGYDQADTLTSVTDFNGHQIGITPNADSLPASETLGSTGDTITTSYDATDSPSAITLKNSTSTVQSFSYSDAPDGSILSETDVPAATSATYGYDGKGRVASMTIGSNPAVNYGFDASSNLTTLPTGAAGTYDDDSELTSSALSGATTSYAYNADGDRLTSTAGGSTVTSATWNGAGEVTAYTSPAGTMSAASYDGNGIRATATFTPAGGSATTQNYVWNTAGTTPELLLDSASAYIYAQSGTPAEQVSLATGAITYLDADSLGSVRGIISSAGTLTASTSYDAWGNPQTTGGLTSYTPFGYAGAYTDPDGLLYLINRYYDPQTGQFTSVDPEVASTLAAYGYASGNPVNSTDPNGLHVLSAPGAPAVDGNGGNGSGDVGGRGNQQIDPCVLAGDCDVYLHEIAVVTAPRPKPRPASHCGGFFSIVCHATHWVAHQVHKHWKAIVKTALAVAAVGLTVANVAQLGLDPATDLAEGADLGALAAEEGASAAEDAGAGADDVPSGPGSEKAWNTLERVQAKDSPLPGYKGGSVFQNSEGQLPDMDDSGNPITYREWDTNPNMKGVDRGGERIVTGSDGSAYYTGDHYVSFLQFWGPGE